MRNRPLLHHESSWLTFFMALLALKENEKAARMDGFLL